MLAAILATSLALAAQDFPRPADDPAPVVAVPVAVPVTAPATIPGTCDPDPSCTLIEGTLSLRLADEPGYSDRPVIDRGACGEYTLYTSLRYLHESGEVIPEAMAYGRKVRVCTAHYGAPVVVFGGSRPSDFALAMACAEFVAGAAGESRATPKRPETAAGVLVRIGLGSPSWNIRQASHEALVEMGVGAMPALLGGQKSRDPEVRERCALILNEIRFGRR